MDEAADLFFRAQTTFRKRERPWGGPPSRGRSPFGGHLGGQRPTASPDAAAHRHERAGRTRALVRRWSTGSQVRPISIVRRTLDQRPLRNAATGNATLDEHVQPHHQKQHPTRSGVAPAATAQPGARLLQDGDPASVPGNGLPECCVAVSAIGWRALLSCSTRRLVPSTRLSPTYPGSSRGPDRLGRQPDPGRLASAASP